MVDRVLELSIACDNNVNVYHDVYIPFLLIAMPPHCRQSIVYNSTYIRDPVTYSTFICTYLLCMQLSLYNEFMKIRSDTFLSDAITFQICDSHMH